MNNKQLRKIFSPEWPSEKQYLRKLMPVMNVETKFVDGRNG